MNKVHDYGRKMYCKMATVITMDFQKARGFYDKLGYKCDFIRESYIDEATYMFLQKKL